MKKTKLNGCIDNQTSSDGYELNPAEKYVIDIESEKEFQTAIITSFQVMGPPPAIKNYHAWLFENGFDIEVPNPTNEFVSAFYGVKPLWKTNKRTKVILTPSGCV